MFIKSCTANQSTHPVFSNFLFLKIVPFMNMEIYGTDSSGKVCFACWVMKARIDTHSIYGLDGRWIESWQGARFFTHVQTGPGAHPASCTMGIGSFLRVKWPGRGADHPPPPSTEVENE
jgi:hypothetical protein